MKRHIPASYYMIRQMQKFEQRTLKEMLAEAKRPVSSISEAHIEKLLAACALNKQWTFEKGRPEFGEVL